MDKLWELYEQAVWEYVKAKKRQDCSDSYAAAEVLDVFTATGKMNGILKSIETLSEDKKSTWIKSFEIWTRVNKNVSAYDFWVSCEERLPEQTGWYLTSREDKTVTTGYFFDNKSWREARGQKVIAWMPLPNPYSNQ